MLGTYCEYTAGNPSPLPAPPPRSRAERRLEIACAVPAAKILSVPDSIGLDVAQACLTQGLTAHYLTHDAHAGLIKEGEWMLIHGVGSGACQWAAQMAKLKVRAKSSASQALQHFRQGRGG